MEPLPTRLAERVHEAAALRLRAVVPSGASDAPMPDRIPVGTLIAGVAQRVRQTPAPFGAGKPGGVEWSPRIPGPPVAAYREAMDEGLAALRAAHQAGAGGLEVAAGRSALIDAIVRALFDHAIAEFAARQGSLPCPVALLALGGYGRRELCPFSDIDVMFLFPDRAKVRSVDELKEVLTRTILYPLWDLNLKIGHSTRTIREAMAEAKEDILTKNALLEARHVAGSEALFAAFHEAYLGWCRKDDPQAYIQRRLADQASRRLKAGDSVFMQEPDIKNGVGGLRDYQNILWMAAIKLGRASPEDLAEQGYLRPAEALAFRRAYEFLLRVRNELHFMSPRATDLLDLEKQPAVAAALGYAGEDLYARVEAFMRDYYRQAQRILRTSQLLEQRLALASITSVSFKAVIASRRLDRKRHVDGLVLTGRTLAADSPRVFADDPERVLRVYRHAQQYGATLDFELVSLINETLPGLPPDLHRSPAASKVLRSILADVGNVHPTLALMHEHGVLERVVPEFGGLTCLVQHELYHRYTADIHTLNTIAELDRICTSDEPAYARYREALHETEEPWLLYLALLLHDIGKAQGIRGHAERGAVTAADIMRRLGLGEAVVEKVVFIIRQHLEMARFWQHHDVEDPVAARTFARSIGDPELLRYLYVHTYCDARGTASSLWNSFKDMLHTTLYSNAIEILTGPESGSPTPSPRRAAMTPPAVIEERLPGISREEIEAHYHLLPERYFVHNQADEIALHIRMVHELLEKIAAADSIGSLIPVVDWQDDLNLSLTVVNIVTWDRAGLFFKLAGAFAVAGLSIVSSKAISREDHITIDTFYVVEPGGGVVQQSSARALFQKSLESALVQQRDLMPDIVAQARRYAKPSWLKTTDYLRAPVPVSVDAYHELSLRRTIIEIQANDQIGLLYRLAKTIFERGFDITFARISTERGVAVDTFYIEPIEKPADGSGEAGLMGLRDALEAVVRDDLSAS